MSVLTESNRDVCFPHRERSSITSNFTIDALISNDSASTRRRSLTPACLQPLAAEPTSHDGVLGGVKEAISPPPTPPELRQLTATGGWAGQLNIAAMRRLLPTYQLNCLTGKTIVYLIVTLLLFFVIFPLVRQRKGLSTGGVPGEVQMQTVVKVMYCRDELQD